MTKIQSLNNVRVNWHDGQSLLCRKSRNYSVVQRATWCKQHYSFDPNQLRISKIEECGTAAAYCGVMDCLYPGTFPYSKVKWGAKHEHEFVENYKVLQAAFDKNGVKRHIDVAKLSKTKY